MEINLSEELKRTFNLLSVRREAEALRTKEDWEALKEIRSRYKNETEHKVQEYEETYEAKTNAEVKKLMDKAGSDNLDFTHPDVANDAFKKERLIRQAHKQVQYEHEKEMGQLADNEIEEIEALIEKAQSRDALFGKAEQDFNQTVDRRDGQERRITRKR